MSINWKISINQHQDCGYIELLSDQKRKGHSTSLHASNMPLLWILRCKNHPDKILCCALAQNTEIRKVRILGSRTRDSFCSVWLSEVVTSYEPPSWEKAKIGKTSLVSGRKVKCANLQECGNMFCLQASPWWMFPSVRHQCSVSLSHKFSR